MPKSALRRAVLFFCLSCTLAPNVQADSKSAEIERLAQHISTVYNQPATKVKAIVSYAYNHQDVLSPTYLLAMIAKESGFNEKATNSYGAVGLMQVVPRYHPDLVADIGGPSALKHGPTNLKVGLKVLEGYMDAANGNLRKAMRRYTGSAAYPAELHQKALKFKAIAKAQ